MQAPQTTMLASAPAAKGQENTSHLLYQAATVLAILLFLVSFWSC